MYSRVFDCFARWLGVTLLVGGVGSVLGVYLGENRLMPWHVATIWIVAALGGTLNAALFIRKCRKASSQNGPG